jgi:nucleotide-binding universal stress UspA family protein
MNETTGVVVGYDGSDHAMQALDWAMDEAEFRRLPLTVCHAWQWPYGDGDEAARNTLRHAAQHVLWHGADCARASSSTGLDVRADLHEGSAAGRLADLSAGAEVLVVGSRGLSGLKRAMIGSVAAHAVAHARCPVIVVRGAGPLPRRLHPGSIVAGLADDDEAEAVLGFACREAAMRGVPVLAVHAWRQPPVAWGGSMAPALDPLALTGVAKTWLDQALAPWRGKYPDVTIDARTPQTSAKHALLDVTDATLMVVGAPHGQFGSVATALVHHAPCPVAIVRV